MVVEHTVFLLQLQGSFCIFNLFEHRTCHSISLSSVAGEFLELYTFEKEEHGGGCKAFCGLIKMNDCNDNLCYQGFPVYVYLLTEMIIALFLD